MLAYIELIQAHGIASKLLGTMGRYPCYDGNGLKKGPWAPEEDKKLAQCIQKYGHGSWKAIPKLAGLNRCGKSCRLRWTNYLRPDIKRGNFTAEEEETILNLHSILGNKWSAIAKHLPGRTDNEVKNFWNTHLKKKLKQMGFDTMTHLLRADQFGCPPELIALANLTESMGALPQGGHAVKLQEALQLAKYQYINCLLQSAAAVASSSSTSLNMDAFHLLDSFISPLENGAPLNDQMPSNPAPELDFPSINELKEDALLGKNPTSINPGGASNSSSCDDNGGVELFWSDVLLDQDSLVF